jgi:hypothetical protein
MGCASSTPAAGGSGDTGSVYVYFDIKQGDQELGQIVMLMYKDVTPRTCENL